MNANDLDVGELLTAAKVAEVAERFDDMCLFLKRLVEIKCGENKALDMNERNLLSVAYKNVVGTKRQSWRVLTQANFPDLPAKHMESYKSIIENELEIICLEVIKLLNTATNVSKACDDSDEDVVFYLKMSGDYHRYLSEFKEDENKDTAEEFYKNATEVATEKLPETHPTRLGLALNYSVCCYEILGKKEKACEIAKGAFDSAIEKLDTLNDSSYKDSTLIMQLLRDNLTLWTSENQETQE